VLVEKGFESRNSSGTERRGTWVNFRVIFSESAESQIYEEMRQPEALCYFESRCLSNFADY
jgi:hypothetical protein